MSNKNEQKPSILEKAEIKNAIWVSVSEAAKLGGVQSKTIRRAIAAKEIKYKIIKDRYSIDFASLIIFYHKRIKLKNKLTDHGLGQYITGWKE